METNDKPKILLEKDGMKFVKLEKNKYNLSYSIENKTINLEPLINFELIKLIYDLNPDIYEKVIKREIDECKSVFKQNIEKGITQGYYREGINIESFIRFYYTIIFNINETTISEKEAQKLELEALEYHTRAMATPKGIIELEKHLQNLKYIIINEK